MSMNSVVAIRSLELGATNFERTANFYEQAWGLRPVLNEDGLAMFRATGREHHVLSLVDAAAAGVRGVDFAAPERADVDALHQRALASGHFVLNPPHERAVSSGGGWALDLATPDGLRVGISAGVARHAERDHDKTRPTKLTHVVVNSADAQAQAAWFIDFLGFRLSDATRNQIFLRCGPDHHAIAFGLGSDCSLNHAAFEMVDIDGLMYGAGRMMDHDTCVEWGLGRHGPGDNVFSYFVDPEGHAIEYTTEVEQIEYPDYEAKTQQYWLDFPRRPCRWGVARKPSPRLIEAFAGLRLAHRQG